MALPDEGLREVAADEPRSSGDEDLEPLQCGSLLMRDSAGA
jgi:hypothetical protein